MRQCPPERIWDEIATGLLQGLEAERWLAHASQCDECAAQLRASLRVFRPESTLVQMPGPVWWSRRRPFRVLAAAAALVLVAVAAWWFAFRPPDPLQILASAYTDRRNLEVRIPGAVHATLNVTRGASGLTGRPATLLKVAAEIQENLDAKPSDPLWLHAQGRLALLEGHPEEAIEALRAAMDAGRAGNEISLDLATSYYLRGLQRAEAGAADFTLAHELLSRLLASEPKNSTALFNRSIVAAELNLFPSAIADLEAFLLTENDAAWKREGQARLDALRRRWRGFLQRPVDADATLFAEVALDQALSLGLWQGLSVPMLSALSRRLVAEHGDHWLAEMLALSLTPQQSSALDRLRSLSSIRLSAKRGRYLSEAESVRELEFAPLPRPLAAWRDFEFAYRATHSGAAFPCRDRPAPPYPWLRAQMAREAGHCASLRLDMAAAQRWIEASRTTARAARFVVSVTRAESYLGVLSYRQGAFREALASQRELAARIVAERLPISRLHEPLHGIMQSAEALGRLHTALAVAFSAAEVAHHGGLQNAEFADWANAAQFALATQRPKLQQRAYDQARRVYDSSQGGAAPLSSRAWLELLMAEGDGRYERLSPFLSVLETSQDLFVRVPYQRLRALQEAEQGNRKAAIQRLESAFSWLGAQPAGASPQIWRRELMQIRDQLLDAYLSDGQADSAWRFLERSLARDEASMRKGQLRRSSAAAPAVFSIRPVGQRLWVWHKQGERMRVRAATLPVADVERSIRHLQRLAANPHADRSVLRAQADAVSSAIFGSWLQDLAPGEPLLFQAEGIYAAIPFPLLQGKNEVLGNERIISLTSGPLGEIGPSPTPFRPKGALMVDATRIPGLAAWGVAPLPSAAAESAALATFAAPVRLMAGTQATASNVAMALRSADLFHFAGHTVAHQGRYVLLLAGGTATLADVPARVVLSACSTGKRHQEEYDSLGPETLAQEFILAGASEVVAFGWNLDTTAATAFMEAVYRAWAVSGDLGQALFEGRRKLAMQPGYSHPYYWAGATRWVRN